MARNSLYRMVCAGRAGAARRFLRDVRGGATSIVAVAVTVMTVAAAALVVDHNWLVDQRDVMKGASDAAAVAATIEMTRPAVRSKSDAELKTHLEGVAKTYVLLNLSYLSEKRLKQAKESLKVEVTPQRKKRTVALTATADLGGTLFSRHFPVVGNYEGPEKIGAAATVEGSSNPIEVVLAVDVSTSMILDLDGTLPAAAGSMTVVMPDGYEYWRYFTNSSTSRLAVIQRAAQAAIDHLSPDAGSRVAVGVVPWTGSVRLDSTTRQAWAQKGWAKYPKSRHYGAHYECKPEGSCVHKTKNQNLPQNHGQTWLGCLDEQRVGNGGHADLPAKTALLDLPSALPFAQSIYAAPVGFAYDCQQRPLPADFARQHCYSDNTALEEMEKNFQPGDDGYNRYVKQLILPNRWPQEWCSPDLPAILPLSTVAADIRTVVSNLRPVLGSTHSALAILWAQRLLSSDWRPVWGGAVHPIDPKSQAGADTRKVIVLLTDGEDSQCGRGRSCKGSTLGMERETACNLAKNAGIEIFVIAAMKPALVSSALEDSLIECSSQADNPDGTYYFLNNLKPSDLENAFADIANQLKVFRRVQ